MNEIKNVTVIFETDQGKVEYFTHEYGWSLESNKTRDKIYFGDIMDKIVKVLQEEGVEFS